MENITLQESEFVRVALEKFYQSRVKTAKVTLVNCPMPEALGEFPDSGQYAAQVRVNGLPIPMPTQKMQIGDKTVESPDTFILSLQGAKMSMDHLKQFGYDPFTQMANDVPLIQGAADKQARSPDIN